MKFSVKDPFRSTQKTTLPYVVDQPNTLDTNCPIQCDQVIQGTLYFLHSQARACFTRTDGLIQAPDKGLGSKP